MTRSTLGPLFDIDPEIERSLLAKRRERHQEVRDLRDPNIEIQPNMEDQGENALNNQPRVNEHNVEVNAQGDQPLYEFIRPHLNDTQSSLRRPPIQANNFEIKPAFIQMIQNSLQFSGLANENPNDHLTQFLELCDTFKCNGASEDAIRLRLFPFSLRDRARAWLNAFPSHTFTTWDELADKFLNKYFPPGRTAKLRLDISTFAQFETESFSEAWERFKEMCRKCPHHGLQIWEQVHAFYRGLTPSARATLDAAAGGAFTKKYSHEAYQLLEDMAESNLN